MTNDLTFCQMPLDRESTLRKTSTWLEDKLAAQESCFYFCWRGKFIYQAQEVFIFSQKKSMKLASEIASVQTLVQALVDNIVIFLGTNDSSAHFVCDLSLIDEAEIALWLETLGLNELAFIEFRRSILLLQPQQAAILSYGKALMHWQQSVRFCGSCGAKTKAMDGGHRVVCTHHSCQKEHFPRTDPVVVMLVEYQPKSGPAVCLLAEHHRSPEQAYSILAGFVDPGESLQEAVAREVFEEAGIKVSNVRYIDSQPWPFPNTLMIGFIARADSQNLTLEQEELRSADWFTAQQLVNFNDWGDEVDGPKLPRKESIARRLIDLWCEKQRSGAD